jgi:hypothetical protein
MRSAKRLARDLLDGALDAVWDVTLPLSGTCPVCAFWRGFVLGCVLIAGALLVKQVVA